MPETAPGSEMPSTATAHTFLPLCLECENSRISFTAISYWASIARISALHRRRTQEDPFFGILDIGPVPLSAAGVGVTRRDSVYAEDIGGNVEDSCCMLVVGCECPEHGNLITQE